MRFPIRKGFFFDPPNDANSCGAVFLLANLLRQCRQSCRAGASKRPSVRLRDEVTEIEKELTLEAEKKAPRKQKLLFARGFEGKGMLKDALLLSRLIIHTQRGNMSTAVPTRFWKVEMRIATGGNSSAQSSLSFAFAKAQTL